MSQSTQESYQQQGCHCITVGMLFSVICYTGLFAVMTVVLYRLIKRADIMAWQDVLLLSVLNFVESMIAGVVNGLLIVRIGSDTFVLFDEARPALEDSRGSGSHICRGSLNKGIMPGLTIRGHGWLRMTEEPQVRFFEGG